MGRVRENNVRDHFVFDIATNSSTCKIQGCTTSLKGNHAANLERHVKSVHTEFYCTFLKEKQEKAKGKAIHLETFATPSTSKSGEPPRKRQATLFEAGLVDHSSNTKLRFETVRLACVEMVTVNGRPLSIVEDSGFRKILDPILQAMPGNVSINTHNIRDGVHETANKLRETIKSEVKGKLVSVKVDGASRMDRSVLGLNIQYIREGTIVLRTLAVRELFEKHTSSHLRNVILEILKEYNISANQIYSITTDNGANMVKAVKLMMADDFASELHQNEDRAESGQDNPDPNSEVDDPAPTIATPSEISEDDSVDDIVTGNYILRGVRCAAHTLQLAIEDQMKEGNITNLLGRARKVAKKLRTPSIAVMAKKLHLKKAMLDCPTRWHSTLDMLLRHLELKEFCADMSQNELKELYLSNNDWDKINEICTALLPAKIATKIMQEEQLVFGDFYKAWLQCKLATKNTNSAFATSLAAKMSIREMLLLDNDAFLGAIFLDPRFQITLTPDKSHWAPHQHVDEDGGIGGSRRGGIARKFTRRRRRRLRRHTRATRPTGANAAGAGTRACPHRQQGSEGFTNQQAADQTTFIPIKQHPTPEPRF